MRSWHVGVGNIDDALRVKDVVDGNGSWDWNYLRSLLPNQVILQMDAIIPP